MPKIEETHFMSMFDGVRYVVPVSRRADWVRWMCSNDPEAPEYVTIISMK